MARNASEAEGRARSLGRLAALLWALAALSEPGRAVAATSQGESVDQSICRLIERAALASELPVGFFTRLIWRESGFRTGVVSRAGAQGVAQFMPGTAAERGLADPFDPEQAIPASARLLADLEKRFGNLGLAAAAYNAGPGRVQGWRERGGELPAETRAYVAAITGRTVDDWAAQGTIARQAEEAGEGEKARRSCLQVTALLRRPGRRDAIPEAPFAPWGVQLAGNFSKERALASYARARNLYAAILGDIRPMVIGTRLLSRGTRAFYRVRVPADSREAANAVCTRIRGAGGACVVLKS